MKNRGLGLFVAMVLFSGPCPSECRAQNSNLNPTYGVATVKFPSKQYAVNVDAGGRFQTKLGGVSAWVANPPDIRLNYTAGNASLILRVESSSDTTLLIRTPNQTWLANDDGPNTGLNPYLRIDNPPSGRYDIWVGTFNGGEFPLAKLFVEEIATEMAKMNGKYAVVDIENRTGKHSVRYRFRWGETGEWDNSRTLKAGERSTHSTPYNNDGSAPLPHINFEKGIGVDAGSTEYGLQAYSSETKSGGKGYNFAVKAGPNGRDIVDLYQRTKAQEDASFKLNVAIVQSLAGQYNAAEELATAAILLDPSSLRGYAIRGRTRVFTNKFDGALRDFAEGLRLAPNNIELIGYRAETFRRKKRFDRVIEETAKALALDPFHAYSLAERGAAHFAMRNYDLAIADCRQVLKLVPNSWYPLMILGECYIAKGQNILALDYLNQAIAVNQRNYEIYAARAQAYQALGEPGKATLDVQQATRLGMPRGYQVYYANDDALRALDTFQIGALVAPEMLKKFNMQNFEVDPAMAGKTGGKMDLELEELVAGEWGRHRAFKFEAVAGVNKFLAVARLTEAERASRGLELNWYYGPVTSPFARFRSGDDLGGLRVIGNLRLPDRKELTMIFALTYYPPTGEKVENGTVGMLFDGDNARIQIRMHAVGSLETDYLFQSFGAELAKTGPMAMRPGFNLDETTGTLTHKALTPSSLSTRCMHCHNKGFEASERQIEQLQAQRSKNVEELSKIESIKKFLELAHVNGAGRVELKDLEKKMIKEGPNSLLPIDELYRANRQHWLEIYPQYVEMRRDPRSYLEPPARKDGPGPARKTQDMKMK